MCGGLVGGVALMRTKSVFRVQSANVKKYSNNNNNNNNNRSRTAL